MQRQTCCNTESETWAKRLRTVFSDPDIELAAKRRILTLESWRQLWTMHCNWAVAFPSGWSERIGRYVINGVRDDAPVNVPYKSIISSFSLCCFLVRQQMLTVFGLYKTFTTVISVTLTVHIKNDAAKQEWFTVVMVWRNCRSLQVKGRLQHEMKISNDTLFMAFCGLKNCCEEDKRKHSSYITYLQNPDSNGGRKIWRLLTVAMFINRLHSGWNKHSC